MTKQERELLQRILQSRQFANAESLRKILMLLCRYKDRALKEYEIAVEALGRGTDFDPKTDPIVRVSIAAIRERLESWFASEGAREPLRLVIPKGRYQAEFQRCDPRESLPRPVPRALRRFWEPYLSGDRRVVILISELLFFRDDRGNYVRNIFVNDRSGAADWLRELLPASDTEVFRPSYHFMSAGEVHCLLSLLHLFAEFGVVTEPRNARFASWQDLQEADVILIGSSRVNRFVAPMLQEECFRVEERAVVNYCPRPGELRWYTGVRSFEGQLERLTEYALITRRPGIVPGTCTTILSGNHGRVMEAAGAFLTAEDRVQTMLEFMGLSSVGPFPERAQILLQVEMVDFDEEVVSVSPIAFRVSDCVAGASC